MYTLAENFYTLEFRIVLIPYTRLWNEIYGGFSAGENSGST